MLLKKLLQVVDEQRGRARRQVDGVKGAFVKFKDKVIPRGFERDDDDENDVEENDDDSKDATTWRARFKRASREEEFGGRIWHERAGNVIATSWEVESDDDDRESSLFFEPPKFPKSQTDCYLLEASLVGSFIFSRLSREERKSIFGAFEECHVKNGTVIYQVGEHGRYFYVIKEGTVKFVRTDVPNHRIDKRRIKTSEDIKEERTEVVETKSTWEYFGELALLYDCNQHDTCEAVTDCVLWRLERRICRKVMAKYSIEYNNDAKKLLKRVYMFKDLDDAYLTLIAHALATKTYQDGEQVEKKGDECQSFYIVQKGQVHATDIVVGESRYEDITLNPGDSFGEKVIIEGIPIPANVRAVGETTLLWLSREVFLRLFGGWGRIITQSSDRKLLNLLPVPGRKGPLPAYEVDALADLIVEHSFPKGHVFFREGVEVPPAVYFVRSGSVAAKSSMKEITAQFSGMFKNESTVDSPSITNTTSTTTSNDGCWLKVIQPGGYFGIDMLNIQMDAVAAPYTVEAEEDCDIGVLTMNTIWSVVGGRYQHGGGALNVEDFEKHKLLGEGTFGRVYWVSKKNCHKKHAYALKIQSKRELIKYNMVKEVVRERNIMLRLNHPFVIRFVHSSQDRSNIYMLTELYRGGELRKLMRSCLYGMPEEAAAFYAGGILEALSFMHVRRILHRDIKPENVMLDNDGYPVLIDLGFARIVKNDRTFTFCGTPIYVAPEVLAQRGYGRSADLWAWAVLLYEMVVGIMPFYEPDMDQISVFRRIAAAEYEFPPYDDWMTGESRDLLQQMLKPDPRDRLGQKPDVKDVKNHSWFQSNAIDFVKLSKKELEVPWKPDVKDPFEFDTLDQSTKLFETGSSEETGEGTTKEKPLTEKEQELFKDF